MSSASSYFVIAFILRILKIKLDIIAHLSNLYIPLIETKITRWNYATVILVGWNLFEGILPRVRLTIFFQKLLCECVAIWGELWRVWRFRLRIFYYVSTDCFWSTDFFPINGLFSIDGFFLINDFFLISGIFSINCISFDQRIFFYQRIFFWSTDFFFDQRIFYRWIDFFCKYKYIYIFKVV